MYKMTHEYIWQWVHIHTFKVPHINQYNLAYGQIDLNFSLLVINNVEHSYEASVQLFLSLVLQYFKVSLTFNRIHGSNNYSFCLFWNTISLTYARLLVRLPQPPER